MKFTTPEDYASLLESINNIEVKKNKDIKILTESNNSDKFKLFESVGSQKTEVELPSFKEIDLIALKFNIEGK